MGFPSAPSLFLSLSLSLSTRPVKDFKAKVRWSLTMTNRGTLLSSSVSPNWNPSVYRQILRETNQGETILGLLILSYWMKHRCRTWMNLQQTSHQQWTWGPMPIQIEILLIKGAPPSSHSFLFHMSISVGVFLSTDVCGSSPSSPQSISAAVAGKQYETEFSGRSAAVTWDDLWNRRSWSLVQRENLCFLTTQRWEAPSSQLTCWSIAAVQRLCFF